LYFEFLIAAKALEGKAFGRAVIGNTPLLSEYNNDLFHLFLYEGKPFFNF
jgi:hypothetical protein